MRLLIIIFTLHFSFLSLAQSLFPVEINHRTGFYNRDGALVIQPKFIQTDTFSEGLCAARTSGRYGYIDTTGEFVIAPQYDCAMPFSGQHAVVMNASGVYLIDKRGNRVFDKPFKSIEMRENGYLIVRGLRNGWGLAHISGKLVLDTMYSNLQITECNNVLLQLHNYDDKRGPHRQISALYSLEGNPIVRFKKYDKIEPFKNGVAAVEVIDKNNSAAAIPKIGFIDCSGNELFLRAQSDSLGWIQKEMHEGFVKIEWAKVKSPTNHTPNFTGRKQGYFYGLLDRHGQVVYGDSMITEINKFCNGVATVYTKKGEEYGLFYIDTSMNKTSKLYNCYSPQQLYPTPGTSVALPLYKGEITIDSTPVPLNIDHMQRGYFYAASKRHENDPGGFASNRNLPQKSDRLQSENKGVEIVLHTDKPASFMKRYQGVYVTLTNNSTDTSYFEAQDGRLYMRVQAIAPDGEWKDIEHLASSWCGNSYHTLTLAPHEYWEFTIPVYEGDFQTLLRIKLGRSSEDSIYSDTFQGSVNMSQFWRRETYYPFGIMDPYGN